MWPALKFIHYGPLTATLRSLDAIDLVDQLFRQSLLDPTEKPLKRKLFLLAKINGDDHVERSTPRLIVKPTLPRDLKFFREL